MTLKEAAQSALDVQDACNLSGVVFTFAQVMQTLCDVDAKYHMSTSWKNTHPIVTLFLEQLANLNGYKGTTTEFLDAIHKVREIAGVPDKVQS